jgi:Spy/CpxP family protein refolding chaperone
MSTTGTPPAPAAPDRKPRRLRRFFIGSALVAAGIIIGIGGSAYSQGRGWSDDGPRWSRDYDGPRGWFHRDRDGPRWFGRDDDDDRRGWHHRGFRGGSFLTPGRIERMVDRLAWAVDASSEQKQKINTIAQRVAGELAPLRQRHLDGRREMREVLAAPTVDRAKIEALRVEQMKLADEASRHITAAIADAADVLTPAQRADLARRLERFGARRG